MRILVADDSIVFRSQIKVALEGAAGISGVTTASNGRIAVDKLSQESFDVIVLDVEMPEMSGIEALRELRIRGHKQKVVMFSSHTLAGAEATLEALSLGAHDFVTKPTGSGLSLDSAATAIKDSLLPKILQFKGTIVPSSIPEKISVVSEPVQRTKFNFETARPLAIVLGSSTGGPSALEEVFRELKGTSLRCPILITQHMPPVFTASLARRLGDLTGIPCAEGRHGEKLENRIYVAPGDYHMRIGFLEGVQSILLDQGPQENSVRPAVDPLFNSASDLFGSRVVGIILTGMGSDGAIGAKTIKTKNGGVIIQDRESCVVFGMPGAVSDACAFDIAMNPSRIGNMLKLMATKEGL